MKISALIPVCIVLAISACASTDSNDKYVDSSVYKTHPDYIRITERDLQQLPYEVLGEVSVTVQKLPGEREETAPEQLSERMREQASKLGADAIIFARYDAALPAELAGQGRAIRFVE